MFSNTREIDDHVIERFICKFAEKELKEIHQFLSMLNTEECSLRRMQDESVIKKLFDDFNLGTFQSTETPLTHNMDVER